MGENSIHIFKGPEANGSLKRPGNSFSVWLPEDTAFKEVIEFLRKQLEKEEYYDVVFPGEKVARAKVLNFLFFVPEEDGGKRQSYICSVVLDPTVFPERPRGFEFNLIEEVEIDGAMYPHVVESVRRVEES